LYGPDSVEVETVVKELDYVLENLMQKLRTEKLYNIEQEIDVLIVTDHGMVRPSKTIKQLDWSLRI
jgi:predicted AlkP superfamily pyrophosphatase or phosphodiesterase